MSPWRCDTAIVLHLLLSAGEGWHGCVCVCAHTAVTNNSRQQACYAQQTLKPTLSPNHGRGGGGGDELAHVATLQQLLANKASMVSIVIHPFAFNWRMSWSKIVSPRCFLIPWSTRIEMFCCVEWSDK